MTASPPRAVFRLLMQVVLVLALGLLATPFGPVAFAQSELAPGVVALVANTGGDPVLLRETPSFDAAVLSSFPEGTPADVVEGPVYGEDGTAWQGVSIGGLTGYIVAGYLVANGQTAPMSVDLAQEAAPVESAPVEAVPVETATVESAPVDAGTIDAAGIPAPAASLSELPANPVATADLNLRAGPSYDNAVLLVIPAGAPLTPTGEWSEGFAGVTYNGQYGWVDSGWLGSGEAADATLLQVQKAAPVVETAPVAEAAAADTTGIVGDLAAPDGETTYTADVVNLRAGPAETDAVLRVLPPGGAVTVTGPAIEGWMPVWYNGTWGFVSADYLTTQPAVADPSVTLAQEAAPQTSDVADPVADGALQATTLSDVNLRGAPDVSAAVLEAIPPGMTLEALSGPEQGFYQVQYGEQSGWVAAEYLEVSASYFQRANRNQRQEGKVEGSTPAENAEAELGAGGIIWPVSGGLWYIMQGYNGSSHQNQDGLWQYEYSLDLARRDGNTAGQEVISPVNGEVRWTDPSTGGISIDIGNGHAVAMFHVTFMSGLEPGTAVRQGQHLGQISGPGGPGFAGTPHLHFTLWGTNDNGNWDRHAEPFTGPYAISGMDFPDLGGGSQYGGTEFSP
jgi:uncharacterized protein YraI